MQWLWGMIAVLFAGCASPKRVWFADGQAIASRPEGTLQVRPVGGEPLLGAVDVQGGQLIFTPQFPLQTGLTYEAVYADPTGRVHRAQYTLPINAPAPMLLEMYPSGDTVPTNHLKFYLHFSEPMARGNIFRHFSLMDLTTGKLVEEPFRETELWSNDGRRLTLWLHPGRQKTEVNLNVDLGPVLEPRRRYALEIAAGWKSEAGVSLSATGRKVFTTEPADRTQPKPNRWTVDPPQAGSRAPLVITFDETLDHALLHNMLTVQNAQGELVTGSIEVTRFETQWRFTPQLAWAADRYRARIGAEIEDLAGNNLLRRFEVNLEQPVEAIFTGPLYLEFRPR